MSGWIGVDLDGTLAEYDGWKGADQIGKPIPAMVERVRALLAEGHEVRIFTARVWPITQPIEPDVVAVVPPELRPKLAQRIQEALNAVDAIRAWCHEHIGRVLTITCVKDHGMVCLYDDRAIQVRRNTGELVEA